MILFFLSFFWLVICLSSFFLLKNKKAGYFGTIQILLVLSIFDTAIPGVLWSIYGFNQDVDWKNNLSEFELIKGLSFYIAFYLLILLFYYWTSILNNDKPIKRSLVISEQRFLKIALLVVFLWILTLFLQIQAAGGVSEYFIKKAIQRWSGGLSETDNSNLLLTVLNIFKWDFIINAIALLGLYNISNFKFTFFWRYVLPLLCLIIAALTFFRGAIVTVFVGFFFISYINNRNKKIKLNLSKLMAFSIAILFFFVFSLTRDSLNREHTNSDEIANKGSYLYDLFSQGSGIEAVSHIVSRYGNDLDYFYGKTYFDMLLLPIPRSIYTTKPEWYGIDDITRKMGWAESSQSAVTLPGEAYANFGWFGILLAPFFGFFLSKLNNFLSRDDSPLFVIYPALIMNGVMVSNWMAFTGIMNQVITFVILYFLLKLIIKKT